MDTSRFKILIVDDEQNLREAIAFDFKRKGFCVYQAENGAKALEIVLANKIDLVVSDMRMPGGDGMELLKSIRALDQKFPVFIFVTGFSDVTVEQAIAGGAKEVFPKPFDRKLLMESVMASLGLARLAS